MRQQVKALSYGDYKEQNLTTRHYTYSRNYEGSSVVVMVNNDDNACTMQGYAPDGNYTGVLSGRKIVVSGGCFMAEIAGNSGEIWVPDSANIEAAEPVEAPKTDIVTEVKAIEPTKVEEVQEPEATDVAEVKTETETTEVVEDINESEVTDLEKASETTEAEEVKTEKSVLEEVLEAAKEEEAQKEEAKEEASEKEEKILDLNKPYEEMTIEELQATILAKMAKNGPVTDEMKRTVDVNVHHGSLMNWVRSFR